MPDIDPSKDWKTGDDRVDRLIKKLERAEKVAKGAEAAAAKGEGALNRLNARLDEELRGGRVGEGTVIGREIQADPSRKALEAEQKASKEAEAARRNTRLEEERITAARKESSGLLQRDLAAMRQQGLWAGERGLANQGRSEAQLLMARRMAQQPPPRLMLPETTGPFPTAYGAGSQPVVPRLPRTIVTDDQGRDVTAEQARLASDRARAADEAATAEQRQAAVQQQIGRRMQVIGTRTEQLTLGENARTASIHQGVGAMSAYSTEMRRHGALTTEFISATARGAVTVRELGYQMGATISKFGGWLIAGSAVFTALAAVSALGRGAIDSASGVNQLNRVLAQSVNADQATESFRKLSAQFNLPIDQVTQAAYGMGKVFNTQEGAMKGAEAALFAVKVGELDVATATRYLTAIVNGFNLPATQMMRVMDQLNQAQNRFGVSIPDTTAGVAKAAGTFRAAGGDINHLIALITAAQKVTGQTGEVIGTALARSPNFLRKATNQDVLRGFGIDPTQDIQRVYDQVFETTKRLGGQQRQVLAAAVLGPQYGARVGTPLFGNYEKYQEALKETSPQAAHNSAQRELNTLLGSIQERLSKIGTSLEQLGSNLADAGILAPLSAALSTLQAILNVANGLFELFNDLPAPVRALATNLLLAYGALRLMRRVNVGESFAPGSWANRQFTPPDLARRQYKEGLTQIGSTTASELETTGKSRASLAIRGDVLQQRLPIEQANYESAVARADGLKAAAKAERNIALLHAEIATNEAAALEAQTTESALLRQRTLNQEQQALLRAGVPQSVVKEHYGIDEHATTPIGRDPNATLRGLADTPKEGLEPERLKQVELAQKTLAEKEGAFTARARTALNSTGVAGRAFGAGGLAMAKLGTGIASMGRSMGSFFTSIAASLGPLDALLIGGFVGYELASHAIEDSHAVAESVNQFLDPDKTYKSQAAMEAAIKKSRLAKQKAADFTITERGQQVFADVGNFLTPFGDPLSSPQRDQKTFAEAREAEVKRIRKYHHKAVQAMNQGRLVEGGAFPFIFDTDVEKALDKAVGRYSDGVGTVAEFNRRTNTLIKNIRDSTNLTGQKKRALISEVRLAQAQSRGPGSDYASLAQMTEEDQQKLLDTFGNVVSSGEASRKELEGFLRVGVDQMAATIKGHGIAGHAAAVQAAQTMTDNIKEGAQAELERALLFAKTQGDRDKAYDEYLNALSPHGSGALAAVNKQTRSVQADLTANRQSIRQLESERTHINERLATAQKKQESGLAEEDPFGIAVPTPGTPDLFGIESYTAIGIPGHPVLEGVAAIQARFDTLTKKIRAARKEGESLQTKLDNLEKSREQIKKDLQAAQKEARQTTIYEDRTEGITSLGELQAARAPEGIERLRVQLGTLNKQLKVALDIFPRSSKVVRDLLSQRQGYLDEMFQYHSDLAGAQFDYQAAGLDSEDTVGAARYNLLKVQDALARLQGRRNADPKVLVEAATAVRAAERDVQDAIEERADAIATATFNLARAQAYDDPMKQANIDVREAARNMRTADTLQERRQSHADYITAIHSRQETRAQLEIDDVGFAADIGKLSLDAQIREYGRILRTMTLTRDMRRDLRKRIYDLKQQLEGESEGFDLAVGDIKLPTVYEIRRAIQGGVQQAPNVTLNSNITTNVNGSRDPDATAAKVHQGLADAARKNRNMLRSVGVV